MQKRLSSKKDESLKNYAIFRFSPKPRGTVSSARKHVFEKSVAKTVAQKVPSPETRINTGFSAHLNQRELLPLVAERLNLTHFVYKMYRVVFAVF